MPDKMKNNAEIIQYLLDNLTIEEKIMLLKNESPAIKRLNIASYNWWNEALHGVARSGIATVFPQAIGLASTFNAELLKQVGAVISDEGRAIYNEAVRQDDRGIYKGLTFWCPNINIFRDPRWGRGHETYGEDPYLTGELAVGFIKGIQGADKDNLKAAACAKHFAAHSGPESERHGFNAAVSKKDLYETYLPAFERCVTEAKVEAVMSAYNAVNGVPASCNAYLLKDILRDQWGFEGHVVSDCGAICDIAQAFHYTPTLSGAAALSLKAGCDLNCGQAYTHLLAAYQDGLISEQTVDTSLSRLLDCRLRLGALFNDDKSPYDTIGYAVNDCPAHKALNLETAKESLVLLKNDQFLPLDKDKIKAIAVIGPCADSLDVLLGNYHGTPSEYTTFVDGIRNHVHKETRVFYSEGCHLFDDKEKANFSPAQKLAEALSLAKRADVIILCVGLSPLIEGEEGDAFNSQAGGDKPDLYLPKSQRHLVEEIFKLDTPVVVLSVTGSAIDLGIAIDKAKAVIQCFYPGALGGQAAAELLFGGFSPAGRLPVTFYKGDSVLPPFNDYSMKNRTYKYFADEALYPFGFGLSYTEFNYSNLTLNKRAFSSDDSIALSVEIENAGNYDSKEVVQVYAALEGTEHSVPIRTLMAFKKIFLKQGEKRVITFILKADRFYSVDDEGNYWFEPAQCTLTIGGGQPDKRTLELTDARPLSAEIAFTGEKRLIRQNR